MFQLDLSPNCAVQKILVTDVSENSSHFVIPVSVGSAHVSETQLWHCVYTIIGEPMPILAFALKQALRDVPRTCITSLFKHMREPQPTSLDQQIGVLLECFAAAWGWTICDRAKCFQACHKLTSKLLSAAMQLASTRTKSADPSLFELDDDDGLKKPLVLGPLKNHLKPDLEHRLAMTLEDYVNPPLSRHTNRTNKS